MSRPTAAPAHWPYHHRSVEQVDREAAARTARHQRDRELARQARIKPDGVRAL